MAIQIPIYQQQHGLGAQTGARASGGFESVRAGFAAADTLENTGRAVAQATQAVGADLKRIEAERENTRIQQDHAALMGAKNNLAALRQRLLEDPTKGLLSQRGKFAGEASVKALKEYEKEAGKIRAKLMTGEHQPEYGDLVENVFVSDRTGFEGSVDRHVRGQAEEIHQREFKVAMETTQSEVMFHARNMMDERQIKNTIIEGNQRIEESARFFGWGKQEVYQRKVNLATQAHLAVLDYLVQEGRVNRAIDYLEQNKGQMDPEQLRTSRIEKQLKAGKKEEIEADWASDIWNQGTYRLPDRTGTEVDLTVEDYEFEDERINQTLDLSLAQLELDRQDHKIDQKSYDSIKNRLQEFADQELKIAKAHDEPIANDLLSSLSMGGPVFGLNDPRIERLRTSEQRKFVLKSRQAELRARGALGRAMAAEQRDIDRLMIERAKAKNLYDRSRVDPSSPEFTTPNGKGPSPTAIETITGIGTTAKRTLDKLTAPQAKEIDAMVDTWLKQKKIQDRSIQASFRAYVTEKIGIYLEDPKNEGIPPPREWLSENFAKWLTMGEEGESESSMFDPRNYYYFQAEQKDLTWQLEDDPKTEIPRPSQRRMLKEMLAQPGNEEIRDTLIKKFVSRKGRQPTEWELINGYHRYLINVKAND